MGIRLGSGVAAGAAAGVGIDLLAGGLTLGAATALGALAGGLAQTGGHYGRRLYGKLKGARTLTIDDPVLRLLAVRQRQLLAALEIRGHAAQETLRLPAPDESRWREGKLPTAVPIARAHPEWSALNPRHRLQDENRLERIAEIAAALDAAHPGDG